MSAIDESRGFKAGKSKGKGHSKGKAEAIRRRAGELSERSGHPIHAHTCAIMSCFRKVIK